MKSWCRILSILILVFVISSAFFWGGVIGYKQGFSHGIMVSAPMDAYLNVCILREFRRGDSEAAIRLLEVQLDKQIIWQDRMLKRGKSLFDFTGHRVDNKLFMNKAADYRDQYSSKAPDVKIRDAQAY